VLNDLVETVKVPTTPHDLTVCFLECIKAGANRFGVSVEDLLYKTDIIRFSNTIGTNTIIQRDGSKVGLLVTAGREHLSPTHAYEGKPPLIFSDMVLGIEEEISPTGEVAKAPDEKAALTRAQELIDRGARCLVVAFSHSEFNPENERVVRQAIKREYPRDFLGSVPVFLSSDISRRSGEAKRINAAVLNAYIHAKLVRLLYKADEELRQRLYRKSLFIVHNNGAVARVAKTRAINTYNSGPAAGLMGARLMGELYGISNLISADMGGTSFDLGYVRNSQATITLTPEVEGFGVNIPMLAIRAIGAGGGSIASVREGVLQVGPQSAGALPGPACFNLGGTEPTVTDADLILGILDPDYFLGGTMKLHYDQARAAVETKVAKPLGIAVEDAALSIKKKTDDAMGQEIRKLKEEIWPSGENPLLVVYGGAGPAHCCGIAQAAGFKKIIITPFSAVFSAFSSSRMDVGHLYHQRVDLSLEKQDDLSALAPPVASMRKNAMKDMRGEGFSPDQVTLGLELFVKGAVNGTAVRLNAEVSFFEHPAESIKVITQARELLIAAGQVNPERLILSTVSLRAQAAVPHYKIAEYPAVLKDSAYVKKGERQVFLDATEGVHTIPVYEWKLMGNGHRIFGPALIESEHTTLLISPGWGLEVDRYNNAFLEKLS
jgi:N-methylhydantoinase A